MFNEPLNYILVQERVNAYKLPFSAAEVISMDSNTEANISIFVSPHLVNFRPQINFFITKFLNHWSYA